MENYNEEKMFEILGEKRVDKAMQYMATFIPNSLSKFYSLTDNEELNEKKLYTLTTDCNWYDYSYNQNDPFDMKMVFIDEKSAIEQGVSQKAIAMQKDVLDNITKRLLLCSFVDSDYRNLPMWAYYANNYQGYCINYEITRKEIFFQIHYQQELIPLTKLFMFFIALCNKGQKGYDIHAELEVFTYLTELLFTMKHISWRHEKEYRIFCPFYEKIGKNISNDAMGLKVNDITIGLKCKPEYKERIMQIAKAKKIKCYQLCTDENKFLSRQQINL